MLTDKWLKQAEAYKYVASGYDKLDFSNAAAEAMFSYESFGEPSLRYYSKNEGGLYNGYAVGKHAMDVMLAFWREDLLKGLLSKHELLQDPNLPLAIKERVVSMLNKDCEFYDKELLDSPRSTDGGMYYAATDEPVSNEEYLKIVYDN